MIIHATRKLAARLPKVSQEPIAEVSALGNWHADRLTLDRRQCVLFCRDETRAALFIAGLRKPLFSALGSEIFRQLFAGTLAALECPPAQIQRALLSLGPCEFDTATFALRLGRSTSKSEIESWKNSMQYMNNALIAGDLPENVGVAIEYQIPLTSKRVDFILSAADGDRRDTAIVVEFKQWSEVTAGTVHMLQSRPNLFHQSDYALCAKNRIFPRDLFDLGTGFSKALTGQP